MIMVTASNKRSIRLIVEDMEFEITSSTAKIEAMKELLMELKASCICSGSFQLTNEQYVKFANQSVALPR